MLHALIMAGGSGTRFWPLSRKNRPKQFLALHGERTLLQQAFDRIEALVGSSGVLVVTGAAHLEETRRQLPDLGPAQVVGEPVGRDTAACIGLAAAVLCRLDPDARMVVLPADHVVDPPEEFHKAVYVADQYLKKNAEALVTFGVKPTEPATGYGYLHRGELIETMEGASLHKLRGFREKPDRATAEQFLASGDYLWNAGVFCWKAATILAEIGKQSPELYDGLKRIMTGWSKDGFGENFAAEFAVLPKISIDYLVLEKSPNVYMV
ncbi:MAG: mannose-1-phosphate guanylyltransferase, partial [Planctomycetia bacterium]